MAARVWDYYPYSCCRLTHTPHFHKPHTYMYTHTCTHARMRMQSAHMRSHSPALRPRSTLLQNSKVGPDRGAAAQRATRRRGYQQCLSAPPAVALAALRRGCRFSVSRASPSMAWPCFVRHTPVRETSSTHELAKKKKEKNLLQAHEPALGGLQIITNRCSNVTHTRHSSSPCARSLSRAPLLLPLLLSHNLLPPRSLVRAAVRE